MAVRQDEDFRGLFAEPAINKTTLLFRLRELLKSSDSHGFSVSDACKSRKLVCYLFPELTRPSEWDF